MGSMWGHVRLARLWPSMAGDDKRPPQRHGPPRTRFRGQLLCRGIWSKIEKKLNAISFWTIKLLRNYSRRVTVKRWLMRRDDARWNWIDAKVMHIKSLRAKEQLIYFLLIFQNFLELRLFTLIFRPCLLTMTLINPVIWPPAGNERPRNMTLKKMQENNRMLGWTKYTCSLHTKLSKSFKDAHMEERLFYSGKNSPTLCLTKWKISNPTV